MIKELITDISFNRIKLSDALTRAKLIASKVKDEKFKKWISNELLGYKKDEALPDYRILPCTPVVVFQHVNGFRQRTELPLHVLDKKLKETIQKVEMPRSISDIEAISENNSKSQMVHMPYPMELVAAFNNLFSMDTEDEAIVEASSRIFTQDFRRIIDITKQKLIDILLELLDSFPTLENDFVVNTETSQEINRIINNHIHIAVDNKNNQIMSNDKYENKGQAAIIGPNANMTVENLNQTQYTLPDDFDFIKLNDELSILKAKVLSVAAETNDAEKFRAVGEIIEAEKAAENKDGNKVIKHLTNGGKWILDIAKEIGVAVTAEVITKGMSSL